MTFIKALFLKINFLNSNKLLLFILIVTIFLGIFLRFNQLSSSYLDNDEYPVIHNMIFDDHIKTYSNLVVFINDLDNPQYNSNIYKFLRKLDSVNLLESLHTPLLFLYKFIRIGRGWTYAPLQFIFPIFFLPLAKTYDSVKIISTLLPFLFSSATLILTVFISKKCINNSFLSLIPATLLTSLSLPHIFYANHVSTFCAGAFALILLCIFMYYKIYNRLSVIKFSFLFIFLCLLSYQLIYFAPVVILCILYSEKKFPSKNLIFYCLKFCVIFFIALTIFYFLFNLRSVNRLDYDTFSVLLPITYIYDAFMYNFLIIFPQNAYSISVYLSYITLLILASFGLWQLLKSKEDKKQLLGVFIITSLFCFIIYFLLGRIEFGKSRHALILIPLFSISLSYGIDKLISLFQKPYLKTITKSIIGIGCLLILFNFSKSYPLFINQTTDKWTEKEILNKFDTLSDFYISSFPLGFPISIMPIINSKNLALISDINSTINSKTNLINFKYKSRISKPTSNFFAIFTKSKEINPGYLEKIKVYLKIKTPITNWNISQLDTSSIKYLSFFSLKTPYNYTSYSKTTYLINF